MLGTHCSGTLVVWIIQKQLDVLISQVTLENKAQNDTKARQALRQKL